LLPVLLSTRQNSRDRSILPELRLDPTRQGLSRLLLHFRCSLRNMGTESSVKGAWEVSGGVNPKRCRRRGVGV
jgi:hypothetical protein